VKFDGNLAGNWKMDFSTTNSQIFHQISIKIQNQNKSNKHQQKSSKKEEKSGMFLFLEQQSLFKLLFTEQKQKQKRKKLVPWAKMFSVFEINWENMVFGI
jgi:hypothetical protein